MGRSSWARQPARQRKVLKLYVQGDSYEKIAERLGCSSTTAHKIVTALATKADYAAHNRNRAAHKKANPSKSTKEMLKLYVEEGQTFVEIGERFAKTHATVLLRLKPYLTPENRAQHKEVRQQRKLAQLPYETFRQLVEQGKTRPDIRQELKISWPQFREMMAGLDEGARRRWQSQVRSRSTKFSFDFTIACIQEAARLNGGRIGSKTYEKLRKSHPAWPSLSWLIVNGGWSWWVERAGLPTNKRLPHLSQPSFTNEDYRAALERVIAKLDGRLPTETQYKKFCRSTDPGSATIRGRVQPPSWIGAIETLLPDKFIPVAA